MCCGQCITMSSDLQPAKVDLATGVAVGGITTGFGCDQQKMDEIIKDMKARSARISNFRIFEFEQDFRGGPNFQISDGSSSAVSTPLKATFGAFFRIFRDLYDYLLESVEFCRPSQHVARSFQIFTTMMLSTWQFFLLSSAIFRHNLHGFWPEWNFKEIGRNSLEIFRRLHFSRIKIIKFNKYWKNGMVLWNF